MTLAEQREKLFRVIEGASTVRGNWDTTDAILAAISAAGLSIVGPEPSEAMINAGVKALLEFDGLMKPLPEAMCAAWKAMHAALMAEKEPGE